MSNLCGDFAVICGDFSQIKGIKKINELLILKSFHQVAIPAYNEYRRSAKKNAYKADLTSLHKGWLAFGVELDSFCERETIPETATLGNVGMASLTSSKLYGVKGSCVATGTCNTSDQTTIAGTASSIACTALTGLGAGCSATWNSTAGSGPGKHNFIGFSTTAPTCIDPKTNGRLDESQVQIVGEQGGTPTNVSSTGCELDVTSYEMGVYGHVSGPDYYGVSINHNSVLSDEVITSSSQVNANSGC